jgi:hypothetical protein
MYLKELIEDDDIIKYMHTYHFIRKITEKLEFKDNRYVIDDNCMLQYTKNACLPCLGNGSRRVVFKLNKYVLKIALHDEGADSNKREFETYKKIEAVDRSLLCHLATPYYISKNGMCLIMERLYNHLTSRCYANLYRDEIFEYINKGYKNTKIDIIDLNENNIMLDINKKWKIVDYEM